MIPPLLAELVLAHGASGYEDAVQAVVRREAAAMGATVANDVLGSTVATIAGTAGGRTLALFAHADQIGLAVRDAGEDGLLSIGQLAAWSSAAAARQRVRIMTKAGEIRGVVVPPEGELTWDGLRVDIGARDRSHALELVRPGDPIVLHGPPESLPNGRILSAALDDRIGIYAGLELLRRLAADPPSWDFALVVTGQEETSTHAGARVAAERLAPDVAIVLEVTYAGDAPGTAPWGGDIRLGGGPALFRGPVVSPVVTDGLLGVAAENGIAVAVETGKATHSDTDDIFATGAGVACGMVSIPLRYMHSAGEVVQLSDVDDALRLIEAYARSLNAGTSFLR